MKGKWMYNLNGTEIWTGEEFNTKEDAIRAGKEELNTEKLREFYSNQFQVGQVAEVFPSGVDIDFILENVAENTTNETGEVGEDYLCDVEDEHRDELEEKLNEVLFAWMKKYKYEPDFYKIENVETIKL